MLKAGCYSFGRLLVSAMLLAVLVLSITGTTKVSADPIAHLEGPFGIVEVYKGSGMARIVVNGKNYDVVAPEEYFGGGTLAAGTQWEIFWPHPHAMEFTDLRMNIMGTEVAVEQIADPDSIWERIAVELADSSILELYGVPTLRAVYADTNPLFTGDIYDTTWYSDEMDEDTSGVYTLQYECMIAKYLHMPYQELTLRAAIYNGAGAVGGVTVDYPGSVYDIREIGDSIIVRVWNYEPVPRRDLFIRIYPDVAGVDRDRSRTTPVLTLEQNNPNPFMTVTDIRYALSAPEHVTLNVYSLTGQRVKALVDEDIDAGSRVIRWDGRNEEGRELPSGIYFYKLRCRSESLTKRMILLK